MGRIGIGYNNTGAGAMMDRKYGNIADHTEILKRLQKLVDLMEEQNLLIGKEDEFIDCYEEYRLKFGEDFLPEETTPSGYSGGCCPGCDGDCGEED